MGSWLDIRNILKLDIIAMHPFHPKVIFFTSYVPQVLEESGFISRCTCLSGSALLLSRAKLLCSKPQLLSSKPYLSQSK